jgi:transcriptional antiterminator NusG
MCGTNEKPQWYALQVAPKREDTIARLLLYKGYEQFVPVYRIERQSKGKLIIARRPLFPGYVFCRFTYGARDRVGGGTGVVTTPGVIRILGSTKPIPVSCEEIQAIQLTLAARLRLEPWPFQTGQKVEIEAGPLKGVNGIIVRFEGKQRIVLSICLLQRSVAATVEAEWISSLAAR